MARAPTSPLPLLSIGSPCQIKKRKEKIKMIGFSPKEKLVIKRCPFCGTKENLDIGRTRVWWISCLSKNCGAEGPIRKTRKGAIEAWNTRF